VAAGKIQPGQVSHAITRACRELEALTAKTQEAFIELGVWPEPDTDCKYKYRIRDKVVEVELNALTRITWTRSITFTANDEAGARLRRWVARRVLKLHGLDESLVDDTDATAKLEAKHQKLRDNIHAVLDAD
jgi:hypothetical protein